MAYKWKPSKSAKKAFAERMQDPAEAAAYEARKQARYDKRRAGSAFNYGTAGGYYVPTREQHDYALSAMQNGAVADEHRLAFNLVMAAYSGGDKVHHDHIHIVNEYRRGILKTN